MFHIESLQPGDWTAALDVALAVLPPDQRAERLRQCIHFLHAGILDPHGIWLARDGDRILAVQVCVPLAGSSCLFWLPGPSEDYAIPLIQAGLAWARTIGCKLAQALAKPEECAQTLPMQRCGFQRTTRLQQWRRELTDLPPPIEAGLRFESYRSTNADEFALTLERTYDGTLDCPELNGVRTRAEIIAGHRGQGTFHADFWWLVVDGAEPVGVVLLVEMPDGVTWELAYLGVVPERRRRGLARTLLLHALHALSDQPATALVLGVDERNEPARRLYQSLGFVETETNDVFLYFFR